MSGLDLKDWLQYKLETSAEVNISTAAKWIAEFIELEKIEDSTISEAIKFMEWKGKDKTSVKEYRRDAGKTEKKDIIKQQEQWLKDNNIEYDEIVDHDTIKVGDVYLIIGGEKLTIKAIIIVDDDVKCYYTSIDGISWCLDDFMIQHCIKQ